MNAKANAASHKLLTPARCRELHGGKCPNEDSFSCVVCNYGLGACEICGAGECELDEYSCAEYREKTDSEFDKRAGI